MFSEIVRQVDAEVCQRKVGDGDAGRQVFQVDDRVLQFEQLSTPVLEVVHLVTRLLLNQVLLSGRRDVEQHHATAHPLLQPQVFFELHVGPEVYKLDTLIGGANAVDAPEALDDADGIPVYVVVNEPVTVLKVLAFRDTVGCDE